MRNKIIALAFITVTASANIFINNTTPYAVALNDLTTNTTCPVKPGSATNIIINDDYSLSCADKSDTNQVGEITHALPHSIKITKDSAAIAGCITTLPENDILIYIKNTGTSKKPVLSCKNFPPL